jgi:hypothetical protein
MLSKGRLVFFGLLVLECIICLLVGSFFYNRYQKQKQTERAQYVVRIDKSIMQATAAGELRYFYEPLPDTTNTESPSWLGYANVQTYNHDGLNERYNYPVEKDSNYLRVITLGDSFTHGDMVPTRSNWTELLEDALNLPEKKLCDAKKVEVINLGMSGYDVQYIVHRYQKLGSKYRPDLILWFESGTGFTRMSELMQPLITACQNEKSSENANPSTNDRIAYQDECWNRTMDELKKTYSLQETRRLINVSYQEFFRLVPNIPILIFGYEEPTFDQDTSMKQYLSTHPNAQFLPIVPFLSAKTRLADGHPSIAGHKQMEEVIRKQLFQMQAEICPTAK